MADTSPMLKYLYEGHYNGYVISTVSVPEDEIDDLPVHGGITFVLHGDDEHLYGFDTAHSDDFETPKSKGWVMEEAANLADGLQGWAKQHD